MTRDPNANINITIARLMASTPEAVYNELREYAELERKDSLRSTTNDDLEKALLERADRLINLALAQFGGSCPVVRLLYTRAKDGTGDAAQDRAVRLACLSNQKWPESIFGRNEVLDKEEIARLALSGDGEELGLLFGNPAQRHLVVDLFNQEPPFKDLSSERVQALVSRPINR